MWSDCVEILIPVKDIVLSAIFHQDSKALDQPGGK